MSTKRQPPKVQPLPCSKCNATNVVLRKATTQSNPYPMKLNNVFVWKHGWQCGDCGHRWCTHHDQDGKQLN